MLTAIVLASLSLRGMPDEPQPLLTHKGQTVLFVKAEHSLAQRYPRSLMLVDQAGKPIEPDDNDEIVLRDSSGAPLGSDLLVVSERSSDHRVLSLTSGKIVVEIEGSELRFRDGPAGGQLDLGVKRPLVIEALPGQTLPPSEETPVPDVLLLGALDLSDPAPHAGIEEDLIDAVLEQPATINRLLESKLGAETSGWSFLKDVVWDFRVFDTADGGTTLGVAYSYDVSTDPTWLTEGHDSWALGYSIHAEGNVAFDEDVNPEDFLRASASIDFFRSKGGTAPGTIMAWNPTEEERERARNDPAQRRYEELSSRAAEYTTREELDRSQDWKELYAYVQDRLSTQYYFEFGVEGGFESDQEMSERNGTLGGYLGVDIKGWRRDSAWAKANLFDFPTAALRFLTGYDSAFQPRGSSIPSLLLSFERVLPEGDDPRADVGDKSDYDRLRAEVSFQAPVARMNGKDYHLTANYRGYHELNASSEVDSADLDFFDYVTLRLRSDQGYFVSYASGRLPFNDGDDQFLELGFTLDL